MKGFMFYIFMAIAVINLGNYFITRSFHTYNENLSLLGYAALGAAGAIITYRTMPAKPKQQH